MNSPQLTVANHPLSSTILLQIAADVNIITSVQVLQGCEVDLSLVFVDVSKRSNNRFTEHNIGCLVLFEQQKPHKIGLKLPYLMGFTVLHFFNAGCLVISTMQYNTFSIIQIFNSTPPN